MSTTQEETMSNASFNLSELNGINGFALNGIADGASGFSVSGAGDINGDGFDDVIIGAAFAGQSYVVFGGATVGSGGSVELSSVDGTNGFAIDGINGNEGLGRSVSAAGDINNDGLGDIIIGGRYVIFGDENIGSNGAFNLSFLDGSNGFTFNSNLVASVSDAGDVNGDGIDDVILGAPSATRNYIRYPLAGQSYVIFGDTNVGSGGTVSSLNGANGFTVNGFVYDLSGYSVGSAGDVNGDGFDDLLIGAPFSSRGNNGGVTYVIFGGASVGSSGSFNISNFSGFTLDGNNGFTLFGIDRYDNFGYSVSSAGDVNNDGFDDIVIAAPFARQSYVIFGGANVANNDISSLDGSNGFVLDGGGRSVSNAGDVNGDGIDDVIIGASDASPNGDTLAGQSYVVFGDANLGSGGTINISSLDGSNGFALNGIASYDYSGTSVSAAGDINGDGIDDIVIGAPGNFRFSNPPGQSYVIYGNTAPTLDLNSAAPGINFTTNFSGTSVSIVDSANLILTDNNSDTLSSATVKITNPLDGIAESLSVNTSNTSITANYDFATGVLSLSGRDTIANYQQILQSISYNNTNGTPTSTNRIIEFVVDDGQAFSNTSAPATSTVEITSVMGLENTGFETGNFSGWETLGDATIQTSSLGIAPSEGNFQALITNGLATGVSDNDIEAFLGLTQGTLDNLIQGNATQASAIKQTFTGLAGDTLTFDWNFLTNEDTPSSSNNDFAFYTLTPTSNAVELASTTSSGFSASPVLGYFQQTGYRSISVNITQSGIYTLGLGVVDVSDNIVNSALAVDNFQTWGVGSGE